jgi:CRISPR-associated protein Cmr2
MSAHLLQLALGPVQEFIAAARRTRDLWFGSHLLSEISKAAARAVRAHGGNLIFPVPQTSADLDPGSELNVANIILAEIHGHPPQMIARSAREGAQMRWREFADAVRADVRGAIREDGIWEEQVDDVVEFYAAWVPFTPETYAQQRQHLARLLAGRKACRDFLPARGYDGLPKSSLDGLRETVLIRERRQWPARLRHGLRVREGEQLDVVGLVKRRAPGKNAFPSVSRVAADPWVRGLVARQGQEILGRLVEVCQGPARDLLTELHPLGLHQDYRHFPFEGSALYRSRHHELIEESGADDAQDLVRQLSEALRNVEHFAGKAGLGSEPDPYFAVVVADGDRMGAAISKLVDPRQHRTFSGELSRFAVAAVEIVRTFRGVLIYSGGDDVLAFVPVDQVLRCARSLHTEFFKTMVRALPHEAPEGLPTLSVGVAIGHFLENLEDLLTFGREAEKDAKKPDRDGLAVHLHKRGGAPVKFRQQWGSHPDLRLQAAAGWFLGGVVSSRTPYELDRLASVYDGWPAETPTQVFARVDALRRDAIRLIDRKRPPGSDNQMDEIRTALQAQVGTPEDLRSLAAELLIARHLATGLRQSGGQQP